MVVTAGDMRPLHGEGRTFGLLAGLPGELMAEFFGTFVLIALGEGVVAMAVAALPGSGRATSTATVGDWLLITGGWALAVAFAVWTAGGVSGAHLNPAITLGLAVRRRFSWQKVLPYWGAQVIGAFAGAALVFGVYRTAINAFDLAHGTPKSTGNALATFSIFATFPARYFGHSVWGPLIDQIVGTAFLLICVTAISDKRNTGPKGNLSPLVVGLAVAAIGMSYGANAGYAINPARDFGPRLFAFLAGWGRVALPGTYSTFSNYWWIPIVGPLAGGVIGILLYDYFIGDVLRARLLRTSPPETEPAPPEIPVAPAPALRPPASLGDITGGGGPVCRLPGRSGGPRRGGLGPEPVPPAVLAAACVPAGTAAADGWAVAGRAGGVGAGGLALAEQVVAVPADGGGLAAGLGEPAAGLAAAAGGAARAGQQQAQPEQGQCPDHDAVQEQRAGRAGHVVAEHREGVSERVPVAAIGQDAGQAGDHRRDQDDEPDNDDHDVLRDLSY
jgi:glycerol uptake facilitator protein